MPDLCHAGHAAQAIGTVLEPVPDTAGPGPEGKLSESGGTLPIAGRPVVVLRRRDMPA